MAEYEDTGSTVEGGYWKMNVDNEPRYRVPDLLTETEFIAYMDSVYGVTVSFS